MTKHLVGLSGNLERPSRTRALVGRALDTAAMLFDVRTTLIDLPDLSPSLGTATRAASLDQHARAALETILAGDALVVGSPTYKGSYTGLLKHLFDLVDPAALQGRPVLLIATGGGDRHALIIEHQLRPLLGFFEAQTLATGVYAADRDFVDGQPTSASLLARLDRSLAQFTPFLPLRPSAGSPTAEVAQALRA
jgi:FMN reductase